jgi:MinD-like ATPase involved in chromosome partitioning or flagellar assembly
MTKTIGIIAIKGGVGKTTISASLAADLVNNYSKKVLLVDTNFSAPNLGLHMDIIKPKRTIHEVLDKKALIKSSVHNRFGVDVIPGSYVFPKPLNYLKFRDKIKTLKENYDFIILDSSPSLNEELLATMLASDALFVVTTPDYPTLSCSISAAQLAKNRGKPIHGIIINKIRDPSYELSLREIEEATEIPVIARFPDTKLANRAVFTRMPLSIYDTRSTFSKEISRLNGALTLSKAKSSFFKRLFSIDFRKEEVNRELLKESFYNPLFSETDEQ